MKKIVIKTDNEDNVFSRQTIPTKIVEDWENLSVKLGQGELTRVYKRENKFLGIARIYFKPDTHFPDKTYPVIKPVKFLA